MPLQILFLNLVSGVLPALPELEEFRCWTPEDVVGLNAIRAAAEGSQGALRRAQYFPSRQFKSRHQCSHMGVLHWPRRHRVPSIGRLDPVPEMSAGTSEYIIAYAIWLTCLGYAEVSDR